MTHKVASKLVNACIESMSWHDFDARHDQPPTRASQDVRSFKWAYMCHGRNSWSCKYVYIYIHIPIMGSS